MFLKNYIKQQKTIDFLDFGFAWVAVVDGNIRGRLELAKFLVIEWREEYRGWLPCELASTPSIDNFLGENSYLRVWTVGEVLVDLLNPILSMKPEDLSRDNNSILEDLLNYEILHNISKPVLASKLQELSVNEDLAAKDSAICEQLQIVMPVLDLNYNELSRDSIAALKTQLRSLLRVVPLTAPREKKEEKPISRKRISFDAFIALKYGNPVITGLLAHNVFLRQTKKAVLIPALLNMVVEYAAFLSSQEVAEIVSHLKFKEYRADVIEDLQKKPNSFSLNRYLWIGRYSKAIDPKSFLKLLKQHKADLAKDSDLNQIIDDSLLKILKQIWFLKNKLFKITPLKVLK